MNYDFLKVHDFTEIFTKYNFSWLGSVSMVGLLQIDTFFPVISQIVLLLGTQLILFVADFARNKWIADKKIEPAPEIPKPEKLEEPEKENSDFTVNEP